jgi:uncharacterized membrane protein
MSEMDEVKSRGYGLERSLALTDGVFAISMTLLVLDLAVPVLSLGASSGDLWKELSAEGLNFINFLLSFLIAGVWWNGHHHDFGLLRRSDSTLRWLNMLFLIWIALLPFFTKIFHYINLSIAVMLYALNQAGAGFFLALSWWYATRNHRLVDEKLSDNAINFILFRNLVPPIIFSISMIIAIVNPTIAIIFWFVMIPLIRLIRLFERKSS